MACLWAKDIVVNGMFRLNLMKENASVYFVDSFSLWHARLGHVIYNSLLRMTKLGLLPSKLHDDRNKCETCVKTKLITRKPFGNVNRSSSTLLELIHIDICDLHGKLTRGGKRYFITYIDDFAKYASIYLLRIKEEALDKFKIFKAEVENVLNGKIKTLRNDRGGEYFNKYFDHFCEDIIHQSTSPYTPQQNGITEWKNRTLLDMVNAMLEQ